MVGNLRASRNLQSILYHVVVVTGERDMSRAGGLTEKKAFLSVHFVSAVENKMSAKAAHPAKFLQSPLSAVVKKLLNIPMSACLSCFVVCSVFTSGTCVSQVYFEKKNPLLCIV